MAVAREEGQIIGLGGSESVNPNQDSSTEYSPSVGSLSHIHTVDHIVDFAHHILAPGPTEAVSLDQSSIYGFQLSFDI